MNLRPTARIIVPTAAMSILLLLLGGVAAWYLHRLQQDSAKLLSDSVDKVEAAEELEVISHELRYQLWQYLAVDEQRALTAISQKHEDADRWLTKAQEVADTDRERELIGKIEQGYARLFGEFATITQDNDTDENRREVFDIIHDTAANEILQPANELRSLTRQRMVEASRRGRTLADRMGMGLA